jgi:hypothetical protein
VCWPWCQSLVREEGAGADGSRTVVKACFMDIAQKTCGYDRRECKHH